MNIAIIGTGYVGLVTGLCFANKGKNIKVFCVDNNVDKINRLNNGECIIYEPELDNLLKIALENKSIEFTTNIENAIRESEVVFSAVGTPPGEDGSADLSYVLAVAKTFGQCQNNYKVFVTKSTVPVGTGDKVRRVISEELLKRFGKVMDFGVCSNPEFLREGRAVYDVMNPDRIVIGISDDKSKEVIYKLYEEIYPEFTNGKYADRLVFTDVKSAEMIKYASNAMLATRISFTNNIATLCEKVGADIGAVSKGMGLDSRIGPSFLVAGCGYGGSCFPKDVKALIKTGEEYDVDMKIIKATEEINKIQKDVLFDKLCSNLFPHTDKYNFNNMKIAVLGCAFKPETDDMREAPSINLINSLITCNAKVAITDPVAMNNCKLIFGDDKNIEYFDNVYDCCYEADAIVLVTEWKNFKDINWEDISNNCKHKNIPFIDGRNMFSYKCMEMKKLFDYKGIGKHY